MTEHPRGTFADPRAVDTFRALMHAHENVLDWMSHDEGLEHFDAFVTRKDAFRYLMHAHAGSLVLLYQPTPSEHWDDARVVACWQGNVSVVARSLGEWLTLLPWPVLGEFFSAVMMHDIVPETYPAPPQAIQGERLQRIADDARATPGYDDIVARLNAAGFPPATDPVGIVWQARALEPGLTL